LLESLAKQLINNQPPEIQYCILSAALLNEFCAELIESICQGGDPSLVNKKVGKQVIELLQQSDMFIISLDDHNQWFRFHHLFQDILNSILHKTLDKVTIQQIHEKAANWFECENKHQEAIDHFLKADKLSKAIQLFEGVRKDLINDGNWRKYEQLFFKFDNNIISNEPTLILANCWYLVVQAKYPAFFGFLHKVADNFELLVAKRDGHKNMMGEWHVMLAYQAILLSQDIPNMAVHADFALTLLDKNNRLPIVYAVILKAMHLRIIGKTEEAISFYYSHLNSNPNSVLNSFLLTGLCYNHWMEFDLNRLKTISTKLTTIVGENDRYMESYAQGYYFLGIAAYVQNDLPRAKAKLEEAYAHQYKTLASARIFTQIALAFTFCDLGNAEKGNTIIEQLKQNSIEERNDYLLNIANAAQAELYIRSGKVNEVIRWLKNYTPEPLTHSHGFYIPRITYIRALVITDGELQLEKALSLLEEWEQFLESVRARNFLVDVYTHKALVLHLLKQEKLAILSLEHALQLSQKSGAIKNFIDAGPKFVDWYNSIHDQLDDYPISIVILRALNDDTITDSQIMLSVREQEILELMSLQLSNKEIGSRLFISEATVKRHITNILKKLNTTNRKKQSFRHLNWEF
jgi:LuxR family maltose regulon positive regulatory protein